MYGQPQVDAPKPIEQPIPISHKRHCDNGLECDTCLKLEAHVEIERVPTAADCMQCRQAIKTESPHIRTLARYAREDRPIHWVRIYKVRGLVLFSHRTHLDAEFKCEECHGPASSHPGLPVPKAPSGIRSDGLRQSA